MYGLLEYGKMIADPIRMEAYRQALERAVTPGSVVLDIGTGCGILAFLACRFGAQKVYAIDPSDSVEVGRKIATANSFDDRIEFIQGLSTDFQPPQRADVIVSDLRAILPLAGHHLPALVDARERLLAEDGLLIPQRDLLWAAPVSAADLHKRYTAPWDDNPLGFDMEAARLLTTHCWGKGRVEEHQLLAAPQSWCELDYREVRQPSVSGVVDFKAQRASIGHGLCVWFDAELFDGVGFSNAPWKTELIYGSAFFPWPEATEVRAGDDIRVELKADLVGEEYVWSWKTVIRSPGRSTVRFRQSTFFAEPLSVGRLERRAASHRPTLSGEGQIDLFLLGEMSGITSLEVLSTQLQERFPDHFPDVQSALQRVADLSERYGA